MQRAVQFIIFSIVSYVLEFSAIYVHIEIGGNLTRGQASMFQISHFGVWALFGFEVLWPLYFFLGIQKVSRIVGGAVLFGLYEALSIYCGFSNHVESVPYEPALYFGFDLSDHLGHVTMLTWVFAAAWGAFGFFRYFVAARLAKTIAERSS